MHQTVCQIIRTKYKAPSFVIENKRKDIVGVIVSERFDPKRMAKAHSFSSNVCVPLEYAPVVAMVKQLKHSIIQKRPAVMKEKTLHLMTVGVLPEYRREGLGLKLIEATLEAVKKEGYKHIILEASTRGSQKIFKNLGFELLAEISYEDSSSEEGSKLEGIKKHKNELSTPSYQGFYKAL
jgi:ribosomal protein S18 acetylase RimI-like enzyme